MIFSYFSFLFRNVKRFVCPILFGLFVVICTRLIVFKLPPTVIDFMDYKIIIKNDTFQIAKNVETQRELVLLQMIFRHGLRSPFVLYPTDPNPEELFLEGLGQLTEIGRLQNYNMGLHLQKRYQPFITSNYKEAELLASDATRTHYSAYAFIAGLYAFTERDAFSDDELELMWPDLEEEEILDRRYCASSSHFFNQFYYSKFANDTYKKFEPLYKYITYHSAKEVTHVLQASSVSKTLRIEKKLNLTIPNWALKIWDELMFQSNLAYYFQYASKGLIRYRIGRLLKFMVEKINDKINDLDSEKKVFAYSAHGSRLAQVLLSLNQFNFIEPHQASTLVLELWKENQDFSVRWLYFNSTDADIRIDPPAILKVHDWDEEFCPLEIFLDKINKFVPGNWLEECEDSSLGPFSDPLERFSDPPPIHISPELLKIVEINTTLLYDDDDDEDDDDELSVIYV